MSERLDRAALDHGDSDAAVAVTRYHLERTNDLLGAHLAARAESGTV